jgi:glycosyltransferase involved in cell wall biosynthesis
MNSLSVIMPVFNEEGAIAKVLDRWLNELKRLKIDFRIHVYDGGSKDSTVEILNQYADRDSRVIAHELILPHGPTILFGYRQHCDTKWLFQVDSDDEIGPEFFEKLWEKRNKYDFLIGRRIGRDSPLFRRIVSFFSRAVVRYLYGTGVYDVNSPYRLMRSEVFKDAFNKIHSDALVPNVIISGIACRNKVRILELPVEHKNRTTGVSIKKMKLLKAAVRSLFQMIRYRFEFWCILFGRRGQSNGG